MKKSLLLSLLMLPLLALVGVGLLILYKLPLDLDDPSPLQPIAFSHKLHAGDLSMDCRFCHRSVEDAPVAGIPEVDLCRACHMFIATDRPEIVKLSGYWKNHEPIPWVRIHRVPDHAYFPHMMHRRSGIACQTCHGPVETMDRLTRVVAIKMGWCLNCHREHQASIDCWTCHR